MKPFKMRKPPVRNGTHVGVNKTFKSLDECKEFLLNIASHLYEGTGNFGFGSNKLTGHYYDFSKYINDITDYRKWCEENKENIARYKADADKRKAEKENIKKQRKLEKLKKRLSDINNQINKIVPQKPKPTGKLRDLDI